MLELFVDLNTTVQQYIATTPVEVMASHVLIFVGWVPIFGVVFWGMLNIWLDNRQGIYWDNLKWTMLAINIPQDAIQTPKGMENFFNNIAGSKSAITWKEKWLFGKFQTFFSFEIVGRDGNIQFYIRTVDKYRDLIEAAMYAQYPEAQITEVEDYIDGIPDEYPHETLDCWGSEIVLRKDDFLPIKTYESFEHKMQKDQMFKDPILPLLEIMGKMRKGEMYIIQIVIQQPDEQDWIKGGKKFIDKMYGKEEKKKKAGLIEGTAWLPSEVVRQMTGLSIGAGGEAGADDSKDNFRMFKITPEERDKLDGVKEKISKIGWGSKIRFIYVAKKELYRKGTIASMSKGYFHQFAHQNWNKFGIYGPATPKDDYFWMTWAIEKKKMKLIKYFKMRHPGAISSPFYLNSEELATLFHFPSADSRTPVFSKLTARRSEAPSELVFAGEGDPDLPNLDKSQTDEIGSRTKVLLDDPGPLVVPKVGKSFDVGDRAFDADIPKRDEQIPVAGMPAPLPPGLDLSSEPVEDLYQAPTDLPV